MNGASRSSGVVAAAESWRDRLADAPPAGAALADIASELRRCANRVRDACAASGPPPAALPTRSRRAYQWLALLGDEDALRLHVETQARLRERRGGIGRIFKQDPNAALFSTGHLFRRTGAHGRLVVNQGFMGAPPEVLFAITRAARGDRGAQRSVRRYAAGAEFTNTMTELGSTLGSAFESPRGANVDVEALYADLNERFFGGSLGAPRIRWGARRTRRKLGHYDPHTDVIELSPTLDAPGTPAQIVEFVLYHEMLHRYFGVKRSGGRFVAHTAAFRRAERAFPGYADVMEILATNPPGWC